MADKKKTDHAAHQSELAQSGYRLPDNLYTDPIGEQTSAEEKSGDGGTSAADIDAAKSEYGYKGALKGKKELEEDADASRTVDPETGLTIPGAVEEQAEANRQAGQKKGVAPAENKGTGKKK